jgi:hypothetical protein
VLTYRVHAAHSLPGRQILFQQHHATEPVSSAARVSVSMLGAVRPMPMSSPAHRDMSTAIWAAICAYWYAVQTGRSPAACRPAVADAQRRQRRPHPRRLGMSAFSDITAELVKHHLVAARA